MEQCEFCGASLPADASFCGTCGHTPTRTSHNPTQIGPKPEFPAPTTGPLASGPQSNPPAPWVVTYLPAAPEPHSEFGVTHISAVSEPHSESDVTHISAVSEPHSEFDLTFISQANTLDLEDAPTQLLVHAQPPSLDGLDEKEEDEEEKRRRAALLGLSLPLAGALPNAPASSVPVLPGTPQIGHVPVLPGTPGGPPQIGPGTAFPHAPSPLSTPGSPPSLPGNPSSPGSFGNPGPGGSGHPGPGGGGHPGPGGSPAGCVTISLIISLVLAVILGSTVTLGLTVFRPIISLSGSTSVAPGGTLSLQGSSFLPNSDVTLTLDGSSTPLYYLQRAAPASLASAGLQNEASASQLLAALAQGKQTVKAQGDGSFHIALRVDPTWKLGQHTLHASEALTHRGAALNFTITQTGATPTPGATPTDTPTGTPTLTPTTANTPPSLSCATPGTLTLGPLSELSSQSASGTITLCSSGSGQLSWQASWNASWLQLSQNQGTLQAPNQAQLTASASAAQLAAGNYQTTITFTSPQGGSQTVQVSLNVQAGCVNASPTSLSFSGVQNTSNPASQTVNVTNCGLTSNWSASVTAGGSWLSIKPGNGTLNGGASGQITVKASNLKAGLQAGTYSGAIVVKIGSQTSKISVSLTVQSAPLLSVSPTSINGYYCNTDPTGGYDSCTVVIYNTSKTSSLTWSSSASASGVQVQASSHTLAAGTRLQVTILVPKSYNTSSSKIAITFAGPGNSVTVSWYYQIIIT